MAFKDGTPSECSRSRTSCKHHRTTFNKEIPLEQINHCSPSDSFTSHAWIVAPRISQTSRLSLSSSSSFTIRDLRSALYLSAPKCASTLKKSTLYSRPSGSLHNWMYRH